MNRTRALLLLGAVLLLASIQATNATALKKEFLTFNIGETTFEVYVSRPASKNGSSAQNKAPVVLVAHPFLGQDAFTRGRADYWASLGYIAVATDVYGRGVRFDRTVGEQIISAFTLAGSMLADRALLRSRILANLNFVKTLPYVVTDKIAIEGYCFGGTTSLELARSGNVNTAGVRAFVSYHGNLVSGSIPSDGPITGKILALHGRSDLVVLNPEVDAFTQEMGTSIDYTLVQFSHAKHAFTDPDSDAMVAAHPEIFGGPCCGYDAEATSTSFLLAQDLYERVFA